MRIRLSIISLLCVATMWGQERADSVLSLREVSITAIKQSSDLQSQPVASTLVTLKETERLGIVTMKQVSEISPNLFIPDYGSRMTSTIYMRGIGARIDQPAVGLNVDNVPFLNKDNYDFDLVDISRIEVLRGPQSTLYGRNTMAGVINISTLSPMAWQGVRFVAELGSGRSAKIALSGYHRFNPRLAMSLSGYYTRQDGFYRNKFNNGKTDRERQGSVRWRSVWRPTRVLTLDNAAAVTIARQGGYPYESLATGEINHNDTCFYRRTSFTDGLTMRFDLHRVTISSVSSLQYINDNMTLDQDFLPDPYFTLTQRRHETAVTQDVILKGKYSGVYGWMAGVFGFYKHMSMRAPVNFGPTGINNLITGHYNEINPDYPMEWDQDHFLLNSDFKSPTYGLALYHESKLSLGDIDLAAGLRMDYEHTQLRYRSYTHASYTVYNATVTPVEIFRKVPVDIDDSETLQRHSLQLLPKFTATWHYGRSADNNVYLSVGKGYKAGGFNTQMFSDVLQQRVMHEMGLSMGYKVKDIITYKPEKSWNFELGWHGEYLDRRLAAQGAMFYIDCRDQQLTMFPSGTTTGRIMTNAGHTRSYGAELSGSYRPTDRWVARVSYGYTNARFVSFDNGKESFAHKRVPYAPEHTLFAGLTYIQPLKLKLLDHIEFNLSGRGVGSIYWNESNTVEQPFYTLIDASVRLVGPKGSIDLWVNNITDKGYSTFYFLSMGNAFVQRGRPRTLGVTLRVNVKTNTNH